MIRNAAVLAVVAGYLSIASAQERPLSWDDPQPAQWVIAPIVAKDAECAEDLYKALKLSGLQKRKAVHELVQYDCAEVLPGVYAVKGVPANPTAAFFRAILTVDLDLTSLQTSKDIPFSERMKAGWILASSVFSGTKKQAASRLTVSPR
ncbi:MAG: hypothetical protein LLG20_17945 [Acidobacteriales bacterium]|nr:hypothetical protein [Terriglobales bacterium]